MLSTSIFFAFEASFSSATVVELPEIMHNWGAARKRPTLESADEATACSPHAEAFHSAGCT